MKICFKCGTEKPLTQFYKHSKMADGHLGKCKACTKADSKRNRSENIDEHRARDRARHWGDPERRSYSNAKSREWREKNPERHAEHQKSWAMRNPEKRKAHHAVSNAVRDGRLERGMCEVCGCADVQAHHDDYSKPLDVRWLCIAHHNEAHRDAREH